MIVNIKKLLNRLQGSKGLNKAQSTVAQAIAQSLFYISKCSIPEPVFCNFVVRSVK